MLEVTINPLRAEISIDGFSTTEKTGNPWANRYPYKVEFDLLPFDTGNPYDGGQAQITKVEIIDSFGAVRETRVLPGQNLKFTKVVENFWNWNDGFRQPLTAWDGEDARAYGGFYTADFTWQDIDNLQYDANGDTVPEPATVKCYFQDGYWLDPRWMDPTWAGGNLRRVPVNFRVSVTDGTGHKTEELVTYFLEESPV